jgi:hypothetical protein
MNTEPVTIVVVPLPEPGEVIVKPPVETPGMQALRLALAISKRQGHTACVAHAVGVYPA